MFQLDLASEIIYSIALAENEELNRINGSGIFFMPELAFTYLVGKALYTSTDLNLGKDYLWVREKSYPNYGIADLVLQPRDPKNFSEVVFEFKMDVAIENYLADIKKLRGLEGDYEKYFVLLKFLYKHQVKEYSKSLASQVSAEAPLLELFSKTFETKHPGYATPGVVLLKIYKV